VGGIYRVLLDGSADPVEAFMRGRLKQEILAGDRLVAGDRVTLGSETDGTRTVESVVPRRSELFRAGLGGRKAKVVAANVDRALVVVSLVRPDLRIELLDRFLVLAELSHLPPVVVLNKLDLPGGEAIAELVQSHLKGTGYPILRTSIVTGAGIEELRRALSQGTSVLMGPSGVGKSSLLNAVDPALELRTGVVSAKRGGGRHTTVSARLLPVADTEGWVVDTPGFSDVAGCAPDPRALSQAFPEFRPLESQCRFRGCSHLHEPGCAVQDAVGDGVVPTSRYESYQRLVAEATA
jgi:ribosome biogenesis GTPase / thiamine phosphate phosphatase